MPFAAEKVRSSTKDQRSSISNPASSILLWLELPVYEFYLCRASFLLPRARHCPEQVEFVNYSCGAGENCILLAPLGKYAKCIFEQVYF